MMNYWLTELIIKPMGTSTTYVQTSQLAEAIKQGTEAIGFPTTVSIEDGEFKSIGGFKVVTVFPEDRPWLEVRQISEVHKRVLKDNISSQIEN